MRQGPLRSASDACEELAQRGLLRFNLMNHVAEWSRDGKEWHEVDDAFAFNLRRDVEQDGHSLRMLDAHAAIKATALVHPVHPVRRWLEGLSPWDGTPRLGKLLALYFQGMGEPTRLRDASVAWGVGAVARAYEPGCRLTSMPMQVGENPIAAIETLVGALWTAHMPSTTTSRMSGLWCAVVDVRGSYSDAAHWDRQRSSKPSTAALWGWCPRRPHKFHDQRYVEYRSLRLPLMAALEADREQIWAEARHLYAKGARPKPLPSFPDVWHDPLAPAVAAWLESRLRSSKVGKASRRELAKHLGLIKGDEQIPQSVGKRLDTIAESVAGVQRFRRNDGFAYKRRPA